MNINVWHNKNGIADQYFVCNGFKVLFQIPKFIGRLFISDKHKDSPSTSAIEKTSRIEKSQIEQLYETSVNILASSIWDDD